MTDSSNQRLHEFGEELRVRQLTELDDPLSFYLVTSGKLQVFAVSETRDDPYGGGNRFLFEVEVGDFLVGAGRMTVGESSVHLAINGLGDCAVRVGSIKDLLQHVAGEKLGPGANRWVDRLCGVLPKSDAPQFHQDIQPGDAVEFSDTEAIRSYDQTLWVRCKSGEFHFCGWEPVRKDLFLPLHPDLWLTVEQPGTLEVVTSEELHQRNELLPSLEEFDRAVMRFLLEIMDRERKERSRLIHRAREQQDRAFTHSFAQLGSVLEKRRAIELDRGEVEDQLLSALNLVGDYMSIRFQVPLRHDKLRDDADPVAAIAKASRVRYRKVDLDDEWFQKAGGPVLVFDFKTRRPMAAIPKTLGGYELVDPITPKRTPVTADVNKTLDPFGYQFFRSFSDGVVSVMELFQFAFARGGLDIATVVVMGILAGLAGLIPPILTGVLFNRVIPASDVFGAFELLVAVVAGAISVTIFNLVKGVALLRIEGRSDAGLQAAVWDRLLRLPARFLRQYSAGDLNQRSLSITQIRQILSGSVLSAVLTAIFSVFNLFLIFYYDVLLSVVALFLVGLVVIIYLICAYTESILELKILNLDGRLSSITLQFLRGIAKLKAAGAERNAFEAWSGPFALQNRYRLWKQMCVDVLNALKAFYPLFCSILLFFFVVYPARPMISAGDYLAFNTAFFAFLVAMIDMSGSMIKLVNVVPHYRRTRPLLITPPEVDSSKADPGELNGNIAIENVKFRYRPEDPLTSAGINMEVKAGEYVAIVGESGAGKSTLIRLLLGFEVPDSGSVLYDGKDLASLDTTAVRKQMGVVLQTAQSLPGTILENIVGSSALTEEDAWEAARRVGFDHDIKNMPMGMKTFISAGAHALSGGQLQRLMLARAIAHRPRILLLDEATSALDNTTQAIVIKSLKQIRATKIAIAHRLSTIVDVDRIFVLSQGAIIESGTYEELMAKEGHFASLAKRQIV